MVVLSALFLCTTNPFALGGLFLGLLLAGAMTVGLSNGFLGLILFIVYVGGTMVLFSYCFMLSPKQTWRRGNFYSLALLSGGMEIGFLSVSSVNSEFYWMGNVLLLVGVILFVVLLSVVQTVDFAKGSMRVE